MKNIKIKMYYLLRIVELTRNNRKAPPLPRPADVAVPALRPGRTGSTRRQGYL